MELQEKVYVCVEIQNLVKKKEKCSQAMKRMNVVTSCPAAYVTSNINGAKHVENAANGIPSVCNHKHASSYVKATVMD